MLYVPLYVEALRTRPLLVFWLATSAQALLWLIVPLVCYWAPPGGLAELLAIGHEFPLNGQFGPPLAAWLAEIAFRIAGSFGVYVLAQLCVVVVYWCVFALGRMLVGATHAAAAVLLMAGIAVFTVPSPDFGPPLLTAALWAAALLFCWRAVMVRRSRAWYALGAVCVLILLTSQAALILVGLIALFTALSARGRAAFATTIAPWVAAVAVICAVFLHLFWLERAGLGVGAMVARLRGADMGVQNTALFLRIVAALALAQAGVVILAVVAGGWPRTAAQAPVTLARLPIDPTAVTYVKIFALLPAFAAVVVAVLIGEGQPVGGIAPLLILSGLAVIIAVGDQIALYHKHIVGYVWTGLLIVPVLFVPAMIALVPWTAATELRVAQPATAMGRFFAESFERRTGHPLALVTGDAHLAALIALAAPSRPSVFFATDPARSPWVTPQLIEAKGAVVIWRAAEATAEPPPAIKSRFPNLVAEVPQTFERPVRGRLPPLRIGWGMIRPAAAPAVRPH
jgi:hypothetical protein